MAYNNKKLKDIDQSAPTITIMSFSTGIEARGGGGLTYLGMVERFHVYDPRFWDFRSDWVYVLYLNTIRLTPFSAEKIGLSLSHLVPEILGPKVGVIFHQNVLFNRF